MDLFGKKKDENKDVAAVTAEAPAAKPSKKKTATVSSLGHVLLAPVVTEKAYILSEQGTYVFRVRPDANKRMVAKAVAGVYGVEVADVRMVVKGPRTRMFRGTAGQTKRQKKALVTLAKGAKIDLFA